MGNSGSSPKSIRVYLNSGTGDFGGSVVCSYTVPANTPLTAYRLIGPVGAAWTGLGVTLQIIIDTADNRPSLLLDGVAVRQHVGVTLPATNCAWNGVLGESLLQNGLIVATAMQLPGIPGGLGTLPPPMGSMPTATLTPPAAVETSIALPSPELTATHALPANTATPAPTDTAPAPTATATPVVQPTEVPAAIAEPTLTSAA